MARDARSVSPAMDRRWLEDQGRHDPVAHAYALWDLDYAPDRVEFRVLRENGLPTAYLLIWHGLPAPMVHWVGPEAATPLLEVLPPRPLIAVVPPSLAESVRSRRSPAQAYPVRLMARRPHSSRLPPVVSTVRRLGPMDQGRLRAFADQEGDRIARGYANTPLSASAPVPTAVWGAFDGETVVGVASTQVKLPSVWVLGGIYVRPSHRGRGLGRDLTAVAAAEAEATGAQTALYVREDNAPACRAYERVGFTTVERRVWLDAGGDRAP